MTEPPEGIDGAAADSAVLPVASPPHHTRTLERLRAALEVFLCSGIPTQLLLGELLLVARIKPLTGGTLDPTWVSLVTLGDTILLILIAVALTRSHGESARRLFFGDRRLLPEVGYGILLVLPLVALVALALLALQRVVPSLHNVPENPLGAMMKSPRDAAIFALVALVGGGVREEVQRAFLLTRFERHLGGPAVGLVVTSVAFGAGHWLQGWDASLAIGLLGLAWGWIYLRRRSIVAPVVSHAGFNSLEIVRFLFVGPAGV
jgi:membrane protease YdiL (CAAX protease family)